MFIRALFGFVSTVCVFAAATKDYPIANVSLMASTSTVFSMIVTCLWLKEKMNTGQFVSIIIAFFGVICILKPTSDLIHYEALIGLVGGASAGCAYTIVRYLKEESPYIIAFFFSLFCVVASIPFVAYMGFSHIGLKELTILVLTGLATAIVQFSLSKAYSYAPSTKISVYLYSQNLFSLITGIIIFHELPDYISILGGDLINLWWYS